MGVDIRCKLAFSPVAQNMCALTKYSQKPKPLFWKAAEDGAQIHRLTPFLLSLVSCCRTAFHSSSNVWLACAAESFCYTGFINSNLSRLFPNFILPITLGALLLIFVQLVSAGSKYTQSHQQHKRISDWQLSIIIYILLQKLLQMFIIVIDIYSSSVPKLCKVLHKSCNTGLK